MPQTLPKGLIAVEGIDGAGKTELVKYMTRQLRAQGYKVAAWNGFVSAQNETFWAAYRAIRDCHAPVDGLSPDSDQLIHAFNMIWLAHSELPQLLADNDYVLADRYLLGRVALARLENDCPDSAAEQLSRRAALGKVLPQPAATIFIEVDVTTARRRIVHRGGPKERKESRVALLRAVADFYTLRLDETLTPLLGRLVEVSSIDRTTQEVYEEVTQILSTKRFVSSPLRTKATSL